MTRIATPDKSIASAPIVGDRFFTALSVMLLANVVQRLVGLARNVGFCQLLSDEELGQWAMANSFFVLAAPLAVLGLPGSFGKYVEIYRRQNALGTYLRSLTFVSALGLACLAFVMWLAPGQFAWLVFNDANNRHQIAWLISTLAAVTIFNFVNELLSALRQARVVSMMQFINSVSFAMLGMLGLWWSPAWDSLLPAYTVSCAVAIVPALLVLKANFASDLNAQAAIPDLWARIIPFAWTLWCMNLFANLFDVCDRALLLHLTPGDVSVGQALIGQYHCGRIVPNLMLSLAGLLSGILLPYMSADFEAGDHDRLQKRLRQTLQLVAVGFTVLALATLVASPILFDLTLHGRYADAQKIMPIALVQCIWMSLFMIAQSYLFCVERGKRVAIILAIGLILNAVLNYPLIQVLGLTGSVTATAIASGVILAVLFMQLRASGVKLGWRTTLACLSPCVLVLSLLRG